MLSDPSPWPRVASRGEPGDRVGPHQEGPRSWPLASEEGDDPLMFSLDILRRQPHQTSRVSAVGSAGGVMNPASAVA